MMSTIQTTACFQRTERNVPSLFPGSLLAIILFATSLIISGAGELLAQQAGEGLLFRRISQEESGITFANYVEETEDFNINNFIYAYNGGGVGAGDINNDGLIDLFFTGTQSHTPNRLYLNRGGMKFQDISAKAGISDSVGVRYGVSLVDINGDGWIDIYVNKQKDPNALFINNRNGTFTERAREYGLDFCCSSTQTAFLDYDLDGDLDAYIGVNGDAEGDDYTNKGLIDHFFRNNGNNTFTDVTEEVGLHDNGYALSVTVGDVNNDGYPDIYVTNDFVWRDILYINNGNGTFTEATKETMKHTTEFGMGSDIADFNNDGLLDIIAVDMLPEDHWRKMSHMGSNNAFSPLFDSTQMMRNTLQLNRGNGMFSEISQLSGIDETDWSWSPLFGDYDQDGNLDLYITNGYKRDVANRDIMQYISRRTPLALLAKVPSIKLKNYAYRNNGDLTFTKVSDEWGLGEYINSNGAIYADLDNDGDLDLIVNNIDTVASLYRNNANTREDAHWLQIRLEGKGKNRFGVGARVEIWYNETQQIREMTPVRGYLSSTMTNLHFGLGKARQIDRLLVTWPDGAAQVMTNLGVDRVITLKESNAGSDVNIAELRQAGKPYVHKTFTQIDSTGLSYTHVENVYDDFDRERLLPSTLSRNGPGVAVGDVDGNGLDDVWIGAARGSAGNIFLQKSAGQFEAIVDQTPLVADSACEDMGGLFFDADNDGDLDLYVASGGNEREAGDTTYQDRLYLNNGTGTFTRASQALPTMLVSTASVSGADVDGDGDIDLFVAGRCIPGAYPDNSRSFLLINDGGTFTDATEKMAPALVAPGMVTSALWTDFNNDGWSDLIVTGEWMGILFFRNNGGKGLSDVSSSAGLSGATGWWHSISPGDFDNDGDIDFVVGNLGLNTKQTLQPTQEHPIRLYANDFDGNTSRDLIMTYYFAGVEFPARDKMSITEQMGSYTRRRFPTFAAYATSKISEIVDSALLANAVQRNATTFYNSYVENLGDGTFRLHRLPTIAQASPIYGIVTGDFNADGNLDILAMENFYGPDRDVIRYDAGFGLYLAGDGKGSFTPVPVTESGFFAPYDGRSLAMLDGGRDTTLFLVAVNNNHAMQLFSHTYGNYDGRLMKIEEEGAITHAVIEFEDGKKRREEFPLGSGYLSQSSRMLLVTPSMKSIALYRGETKVKDILLIDSRLFPSDATGSR